MNLLKQQGNSFFCEKKKKFSPIRTFKSKSIISAFNFAYDMTFGEEGEHRNHRSGGDQHRRNGEIFANTFQGKLAEFGIYNEFYAANISTTAPDLNKEKLGSWDLFDFIANNKNIAVKSTKYFGDLLLLETKDWRCDGSYIPNESKGKSYYDYFILTRISPSIESILKENRLLYTDKVDMAQLKNIVVKQTWKYDIPGYVTNDELVSCINNGFIIPKNSLLNGRVKMDAENYYIQSGNMNPFESLLKLL